MQSAHLAATALLLHTVPGCSEDAGSGGDLAGPDAGAVLPCEEADDCPLGDTCFEALCEPGPIYDALPQVPGADDDTPGATARVAGSLDDLPGGRYAAGQPGDLVLENAHAAFVIQRPHRDGSITPFGGTVIDAAPLGSGPAVDELGEVMPLLHIGLTVDFEEVRVLRDGADGGPAVVLALGRDAVWDMIDLNAMVGRFDVVKFDLNADLPLLVAAVYALGPDDRALHATFTLLNEGSEALTTSVGVVVDGRGLIDDFVPGRGYGPNGFDEIFAAVPGAPWVAQHGPDVAYGLLPLHGEVDGALDRPPESAVLSIQGITAVVYDHESLLDAVSKPNLTIPVGGARSFGYQLFVDRGDVASVSAWALVESGAGAGLETVTGTVAGAAPHSAEGTRVAVFDAEGAPVTAAQVVDGRFSVDLPPGTWQLVPATRAQGFGPPVDVETPGDGEDVVLTLPEPATLAWDVQVRGLDGETRPAACRVTLVGSHLEEVELRPAFDPRKDPLPAAFSAVRYSRHCDSAADGPLQAPAGRYLAVVTRGPRHDLVRELVDLVAGETTTLTGTLVEVVDTSGYVGMDCHLHALSSPDSKIAEADKVLAYLGEDVDFLVATDHDYLTDLSGAIEALDAVGEVAAIVGVEATPFAFGHFIGYPLPVDPTSPTRGAPDWGGGRGPSRTPTQLFGDLRELGAGVVQLAHPGQFSGYFELAALTFDPVAGILGVDLDAQRPAAELRLDPDAPYFGTDFDAVEVATGAGGAQIGGGFMGQGGDEPSMDGTLRTWLDFLAVGLPVVAVGCSDSHGLVERAPGYARTYLPPDPDRGAPWADLGALRKARVGEGPVRHGDVLVTNGPWLEVRASGAGLGELVAASGGVVELAVTVEAPPWMAPPERLEVYVNNVYRLPPAADADRALEPAHEADLVYADEAIDNGGTVRRAAALVALDVPEDTDAWVVVRVVGGPPLFPLLASEVTFDAAADAPEAYATATDGPPPFALSNPIYVDGDGDGAYRAVFAE